MHNVCSGDQTTPQLLLKPHQLRTPWAACFQGSFPSREAGQLETWREWSGYPASLASKKYCVLWRPQGAALSLQAELDPKGLTGTDSKHGHQCQPNKHPMDPCYGKSNLWPSHAEKFSPSLSLQC